MSTRFQYINLLRVIATISVIFIHVGSMFISSQGLEPDSTDYIVYEFFHRFCSFAVPVFVLISGSLLLNPAKEIPYKKIFNKYITRIVLALLIFGSFMCLAEAYMTRAESDSFITVFSNAVVNLAIGKCWTHMWYLYMLIGLYALTPLYKAFFSNTSVLEQQWLVCILFFMCVLLPYLKNTALVPIDGYITLPTFLFLFPCGYFINSYIKKSNTTLFISVAVLLLYSIYIYITVSLGIEFYSNDIPTILFAISIFHICSFYTANDCPLLDNLSKHSFCIYIVHAIFLNMFYKIIHVEKYLHFNAVTNVLIVVSTAFILSIITSNILHRIPYLHKKVL